MPAPHAVAVDWRAEVPRDVHGNQHQALNARRARHASRDELIMCIEHKTRFELTSSRVYPFYEWVDAPTRRSLIARGSPSRWQLANVTS